MRLCITLLLSGLLLSSGAAIRGADDAKSDKQTEADKQALAALQTFVGQWRGMGQPQRGSTQGAWTEKSDWAWNFAAGRATLVFQAAEGKHFVRGKVSPGAKSDEVVLLAQLPEGRGEARYAGVRGTSGEWIFQHSDDAPTDVARVTIRQVANGDRLVMLLEKRLGGEQFARLAEIGYTRVGSGFGQGVTQRECVVTGGIGNITVSYQGQTYYVCCTGCKDLFESDPAGVLAEYKERVAKKLKEPKK